MIIGFALVFNADVLTSNVHWGVAPTWENLAVAIPVAMLAYTGVETVSNLAEEARDPVRTVPNAYKAVAGAVFAIYFTLPFVALSALPVERIDGELTTRLALPPEEGGYANDPILGVVQNLGIDEGWLLDGMEIYVGVLAATILFIATNAGVIGASRITYSMASYRQLPEIFRRLHPRLKTPWLSLVVFAGILPILVILPGDVNFVGTLYSLGATLSFTVAHISIVRMRMLLRSDEELPYRARPNLRVRGTDWPLFAIVGGLATGISFLVLVVQNPATRWAGLGWLAFGLVGYVVYRKRFVRAPLGETVKAPPAFGAALALEYRRLLVPVVAGQPSDAAMDLACRLATEGRSRIVALSVLEIPLDRPLTDELPELERVANLELDQAAAVGDSYGVRVLTRLERAHAPGPAIVREADARGSEIIVIGSPRRALTASQSAVFGKTVDYVLKHAPCRVLVAASETRVKLYSWAVLAFSVAFVGIGIALLVATAAQGGGVVGFLLGGLFVALGVGRLSLERKTTWPVSSAASSVCSTRRRCSRSRTARSPPRCTSRSASSPPPRSGSRRWCSCSRARSSSSSRCRTRRAPPPFPRQAALRPSCGARPTTSPDS